MIFELILVVPSILFMGIMLRDALTKYKEGFAEKWHELRGDQDEHHH